MNEKDRIEFTEFFTALRKYWILILSIVLLSAGAVAAWVLSQQRQYVSMAVVLLTTTKIPQERGGILSKLAISSATIGTMAKLIKNRQIAEAAIRKFALDRDPMQVSPEVFWKGLVDVEVIGETGLMNLVVTFHDPKKASEIANFVAESAVQLNKEINSSDAVSARNYLKEHMDEAAKRVEDVGRRLVEFQSQSDLLLLENSIADTAGRLRELDRRLFVTNLSLVEFKANPLVSKIQEIDGMIEKLQDSPEYKELQASMKHFLDKRKLLGDELLAAQLKVTIPQEVEDLAAKKRILEERLNGINDSIKRARERIGNQDARASMTFQAEVVPLVRLKADVESDLIRVSVELEAKRSGLNSKGGSGGQSRLEYVQSLIAENEKRIDGVSQRLHRLDEEIRRLSRLVSEMQSEREVQERYLQEEQERYLQVLASRSKVREADSREKEQEADQKRRDKAPSSKEPMMDLNRPYNVRSLVVLAKRKESLEKEIPPLEKQLKEMATRYAEGTERRDELRRQVTLAQNTHAIFASNYAQAFTVVFSVGADLKIVGGAFPPRHPLPRYFKEKVGAAAASGFILSIILVFCIELMPGSPRRGDAVA